jgi:alpha-1,3-fucosyltransferase
MYSDDLPISWNKTSSIGEINAKLKLKNKLIVWPVSHCKTEGKRENYVEELKKFIPVDIYGKCGDNNCANNVHRAQCFSRFTRDYKFYLSFENSRCGDYVTEKFYIPLTHYIVPIVYGGSNYSDFAPPGSFIDVRDFKTPKHLAEYLKFLDKNRTAYEKYFEWRKSYVPTKTSAWCQLCQMLNNPSLPKKSYENVYDWFVKESQCNADPPMKTRRPDISFVWRKMAERK